MTDEGEVFLWGGSTFGRSLQCQSFGSVRDEAFLKSSRQRTLYCSFIIFSLINFKTGRKKRLVVLGALRQVITEITPLCGHPTPLGITINGSNVCKRVTLFENPTRWQIVVAREEQSTKGTDYFTWKKEEGGKKKKKRNRVFFPPGTRKLFAVKVSFIEINK